MRLLRLVVLISLVALCGRGGMAQTEPRIPPEAGQTEASRLIHSIQQLLIAKGLCADRALFEGQGAMELEAMAESYQLSGDETPYLFSITEQPTGLLYLDSSPMWVALLEDLIQQSPERVRVSAKRSGAA